MAVPVNRFRVSGSLWKPVNKIDGSLIKASVYCFHPLNIVLLDVFASEKLTWPLAVLSVFLCFCLHWEHYEHLLVTLCTNREILNCICNLRFWNKMLTYLTEKNILGLHSLWKSTYRATDSIRKKQTNILSCLLVSKIKIWFHWNFVEVLDMGQRTSY